MPLITNSSSTDSTAVSPRPPLARYEAILLLIDAVTYFWGMSLNILVPNSWRNVDLYSGSGTILLDTLMTLSLVLSTKGTILFENTPVLPPPVVALDSR